MTLREKLIVLRDKAGISQMSLAHQLDVSRQAVSRWESGDTTTCIWIATRSENKEMPGKQFVDMGDEDVDMPDQAANGFDFEWKD